MNIHPQVSIIVPYFNAAATLRDCLDSIFSSGYPNIQVITVDDGSTDDGYQTVKDLPCHHIALKKQSGAAVARNVGAQAAEGEILFFLDADVIVLEDTVAQMVSNFQEDPSLSAAFGQYTFETTHENFPTQYKNIVHHYTHQTSREEASSFWCGCGAIRAKDFGRVGMFDEAYSAASVEDIDLGYRLHQSGGKIRLDKAMRVTHQKKYTLWTLIRSDVLGRAIPWTKLMARRNFFRADLNLKWHNVLTGLMLGVFVLWLLTGLCHLHFGEMGLLIAVMLVIYSLLNLGILFYVWRRKGAWFVFRFGLTYLLTYLYSILGFGLGLLLYIKDAIEGKDRV